MPPWKTSRRIAVFFLLSGADAAVTAGAFAQGMQVQARDISASVVQVLVPVSIAKHVASECDTVAPAAREARQAALGKWRAANRIETLETSVAPYFARMPGIGVAMRKLEESTSVAAKAMVEKAPAICGDLDGLLAGNTFALAARVDVALAQVRKLGALMQGGAATPEPEPTTATLYTLGQLSVKVQAAMSTVAPAEAAKERKVRESRQDAAETALKALGPIAMSGHLIDRERFREWRGDQQSVFTARCRSFADKPTEERFKALQGQDITVTGEISSVYDDPSGGGNIAIARCGLIESASRLAKAALPDAGGLELRPPEPAEAYAGPGAGIAPEAVAKVVYKADFSPMIDGFGNGYTRRDEDTYILLKDGTAYRHHWRFPFTDVNVPLLKYREPSHWFTWRESGKTLTLTATGGRTPGQTRAIEGYDTLLPVAAGSRWAKAFTYLNIAMMGARTDRNYTFHADGMLDVKTSGFVAGKTAAGTGGNVWGPGFSYSGDGFQGFLTINGKSAERHLRYTFDGYLLALTDDAGASERHFIARFGSDKAEPPGSLYLDGEMLWTRDEKAK